MAAGACDKALIRSGLIALFAIAVCALLNAPALAGTNEWTTTDPVMGGYIARLESPGFATTSTVFAALGSDGVRRLTDLNHPWTVVGTGLDGLFVNDVTQLGTGTLAAATTAGVFRLVDGASSWTKVSLDSTSTSAIDVLPDGTAIAGRTEGGILRSTNDGATWTGAGVDVSSPVLCLETSIEGTAAVGTDSGGVWVSSDAGDTWISRSTGLPGSEVRGIAFGADGAWYAATNAGLAKTTDGGRQWTTVLAGDFEDVVITGGKVLAAQRGSGVVMLYSAGLGVPIPGAPGVFPRSLGASSSSLLIGYANCGVYAIPGPPNMFQFMPAYPRNDGLVPLTISAIGVNYGDTAELGARFGSSPCGLLGARGDLFRRSDEEIYQIAPRSNADLVVGTSKGVYRSSSGVYTHLSVAPGQPELDAHSVGVSSDGTTIAAGVRGEVMTYRDSAGWTTLPATGLPDEWIGAVAVASNGRVIAGTAEGLMVLDPGQTTWTAAPEISGEVHAACALPNGTLLVAGEFEDVWKSTDNGATWHRGGAIGSDIRSLWPRPDGTVYAALFDSGAYKSTDAGGSWKRIGGPRRGVTAVAANKAGTYVMALTEDGLESFSYVTPSTWLEAPDPDAGLIPDGWYRFNPSILLHRDIFGATHWRWDSGEETSSLDSTVSVESSEGTHTLYYYSTTACTTETVRSRTFRIDTKAPTGDFSLQYGGKTGEEDPEFAGAHDLIRIRASGNDDVSGMDDLRVTIDGASTGWGEPTPLDTTLAVNAGDGTKSVTVDFRDNAGNVFTSTHSITIDTLPPAGTASLSYLKTYGTSLYLSLCSSVSDSGTGVTGMRTNAGTGWSAWSQYATPKTIVVPATGGTKTVSVEYRDGVGHVLSKTASFTYVAPKAVLTKPVLSTTGPRYGAYFTVSGYISPRVGGSTRLYFYRKSGSRWILSKTVTVVNTLSGSRSRYALRTRLYSRGSWYVRAYYPGSSYYRAATSTNSSFTVR